MCRNINSQLKAIVTLKHDTPVVFGVYERDERGDDLVSLIAVLDRTVAKIYDVNRLGEIELFKTIPYWYGMSHGQMARECGVTTRYRVTSF